MSGKKGISQRYVALLLVGGLFLGITLFQLFFVFRSAYEYFDKAQFLHKKLGVPLEGVYYGYYMSDPFAKKEALHIKVLSEEHPTLTLFFADWATGNEFPTDLLYRISTQGVAPIITWEPWDGKDRTVSQSAYAPAKIAAGYYDTFIHRYAKSAAEYQKPIMIRFAHEMNGDWYSWGAVKGNSPADYISMWRHVHDIFVQEKAENVIWVWSPNNTDNKGFTGTVLAYYPGDMYVDWVGFSAFNWGEQNGYHWKTFREIAEPIYAKLEKLNKPILVAETSSTNTGGIKEQWFDELLTSGLAFFPNVKGVVFYNENFNQYEFRLSAGMNHETVIKKYILNNPYFLTTLTFQPR